jgi:hypothetical protein
MRRFTRLISLSWWPRSTHCSRSPPRRQPLEPRLLADPVEPRWPAEFSHPPAGLRNLHPLDRRRSGRPSQPRRAALGPRLPPGPRQRRHGHPGAPRAAAVPLHPPECRAAPTGVSGPEAPPDASPRRAPTGSSSCVPGARLRSTITARSMRERRIDPAHPTAEGGLRGGGPTRPGGATPPLRCLFVAPHRWAAAAFGPHRAVGALALASPAAPLPPGPGTSTP